MEISINDIKNKFDELPEDLRFAIMGVGLDDKVIGIGQDVGLSVSQMGQLALEVWAVILGWTAPDKFESSIGASLELPADKTKTIANLANERILKKIREDEKKIGAQNKEVKNDPTKPNPVLERPVEVKQAPKPEISPEKPKVAPISIPAQRLMSGFKMPSVATDHSVSKPTPTPAPTPTAQKVDPYREIPE